MRILHPLGYLTQEAIQRLPPRQRSVVWLRYAAQLSFSEVGQRLNIPTTTAKTYFYRARQSLRALLKVSLEMTPVSSNKGVVMAEVEPGEAAGGG